MTDKTRCVATAVILVGLVVGAGAAVPFAQNASKAHGVPDALDDVLDKLRALGHALSGLQEDVDHIRDKVDTPPEREVNYLVTPTISFASGAINCVVTNVSNSPKTVTVALFVATTGLSVGSPNPPSQQTIDPGHFTTIGTGADISRPWVYCKLTVLDGSRSDIRGSLQLSPSATGGFNPTLVVPAE